LAGFGPRFAGPKENKMGELDAEIRVFEVYSKVAETHEIGDRRWARSAGLPAPRLSEMRRIVRLVKEQGLSPDEASKRVKRDISHAKVYKLYRGLCAILGEDYMAKTLLQQYKAEKDPVVKNTILVMIVSAKNQPRVKKYLLDLIKEEERK
jgi:hypothetical protein